MLEGIETKKAAKRMKQGQGAEEDGKEALGKDTKTSSVQQRHFKQTAVASKMKHETHPDQVKRVLSKIF
jgi:ESF2/ABP1 family protein